LSALSVNPILPIAASPELLLRGCVHVIELDGIKSEIGTRWDKYKESVWAHLEALLSQRLAATDFYTRIGETACLVSLPTAQEGEAQIFCLRVAQELQSSLLGRCDSTKLRIARAASVDGDAVQTLPIAGDQLSQLAIKAGLEKGAEVAQAGKIGTASCMPHGTQLRYTPLWDAQKEAITAYRCAATPLASDNLCGDARAKLALGSTVERIGEAARNLAGHLDAGDRFFLWLPVSYEVISAPVARMELTGLCRNLSAELRPYIVFEISDLPYGVPQSRLTDLVGSLRPFCRGVAATLPHRTASYSAYFGAGLAALGLSLSSSGGEMGSEIFKLSIAAKRQHIMSYVLDVPQSDLLQAARGLGVNYLSGPLIGQGGDRPASVRRLAATEIVNLSARVAA
jgi:hypothetical protein